MNYIFKYIKIGKQTTDFKLYIFEYCCFFLYFSKTMENRTTFKL